MLSVLGAHSQILVLDRTGPVCDGRVVLSEGFCKQNLCIKYIPCIGTHLWITILAKSVLSNTKSTCLSIKYWYLWLGSTLYTLHVRRIIFRSRGYGAAALFLRLGRTLGFGYVPQGPLWKAVLALIMIYPHQRCHFIGSIHATAILKFKWGLGCYASGFSCEHHHPHFKFYTGVIHKPAIVPCEQSL